MNQRKEKKKHKEYRGNLQTVYKFFPLSSPALCSFLLYHKVCLSYSRRSEDTDESTNLRGKEMRSSLVFNDQFNTGIQGEGFNSVPCCITKFFPIMTLLSFENNYHIFSLTT